MTDVVVAGEAFQFTPDKIELVKRTVAKGASNDELELFIAQCNRTQLDPFSRQIYAIKRWSAADRREVMQTQVSIDGARLVAQRSREYRGQTPTYWCGPDGQWTDVWLSDDFPSAAKVGVYREGFTEALFTVATWKQYVQTTKEGAPTKMWKQMPALMLGKCAEALALRKAFPMELSGLYTAEEMGQASNETPASSPAASPAPSPQPTTRRRPPQAQEVVEPDGEIVDAEVVEEVAGPKMVSTPQINKMLVMFGKLNISDRQERLDYLAMVLGKPIVSSKDLTMSEAKKVIDVLIADVEGGEKAAAVANEAPPLDDEEPY